MDTSRKKFTQPAIPKSKYELNLAEFPVAVLSKRLPANLKVIEYEDTIVGRDGKVVPRTWRVKGSIEYGFGSNQALGTLFELFQIWKEQDFETPVIRFGSVYNLCKRMGLENAQTAYERIRKDLSALVEIAIEAKNAFWDNEKKAYVDQTFHLFDRVRFYHKEATSRQQVLPFAHIEASKELWGSIEANALITLRQVDSEFFHSLTPTEQRLALYLGKMLHSATEHWRDVQTLARQLPIFAKSYRHVKEQLTKTCDGLLVKGFAYLSEYRYERKRDGKGEIIIFYGKGAKDHKKVNSYASEKFFPDEEEDSEKIRRGQLVEDIIELIGDGKRSRGFYQLVAQKLSENTVRRALAETKEADRGGEIRTSRGRYFTDLIKRYAAEQGIILNPKNREGGDSVL